MLGSAALLFTATSLFTTTSAHAAKDDPIILSKCDASFGTVAVVDGDTQGWTKFGLGSPRELLVALANESGCFTVHNPASGVPADFLMNVIAGDKEEVDQGVNLAKSAVTEGLVRSGAAGSILSKVPIGGAIFGAFGGLGGKKKTVAAGIRMISPATGQTMVAGSGSVKKSTISLNGNDGWNGGAQSSGYAASKDGKMLTEAFIIAFNNVVAQGAGLTVNPANNAAATPAASANVAVDTKLYASADKTSAVVRSLRAGTDLIPTGNRQGLFIEVTDSYGTKGWVSVEDMQ
ncbi:hypothetical protein LPB140_00395 [Sphingorhabdus lutea]|uniref:SH3 domain-containing protein n=2 Tax=Sphingorhabdus lutea TaxID=1913578 RepID=A0A1L3JE61_9SPHN|nr:hypothetical protein LPB140_00395 [Sphingorhabdus lutea]